MKKQSRWAFSFLIFGYAFLYLPLTLLVFYSFNASKYVTIWQGFSLKWYQVLFQNEGLLRALGASLKIAFISATIAVILGTSAAIALTRFGAFKGRSFLRILTVAPMILPEVILGIGFLLAFMALANWINLPPVRGMLTIIIAHATIAMAYVTILVKGRLSSMDNALIEVAQDLGARPLQIFLRITLPIIAPSIAAGWLLSFILSFDDLIVASFVSGAEVTTLPMAIFSRIRFGLTPEVNVLGALIICSLLTLISLGGWLFLRKRKV